MEETKKTAAPKKSLWKNLVGEFRKIVWPNKATVIGRTLAVLAIAILMGVVIALLDMVIQFGFSFIF